MRKWAGAGALAAAVALIGAAALAETKPPPTRPPTQQPAKAGQPKDFMIDYKWEAGAKGDPKPSAAPKAPK